MTRRFLQYLLCFLRPDGRQVCTLNNAHHPAGRKTHLLAILGVPLGVTCRLLRVETEVLSNDADERALLAGLLNISEHTVPIVRMRKHV